MSESVHFSGEHNILRDQVRRFVAEEVEPNGDASEQVEVPIAGRGHGDP